MLSNKFPQPSTEQLAEEPVYVLRLNPFWWSIVQGQLEAIGDPSRWYDYEAVRDHINNLVVPSEE